jgi:hypothetical protein
MAPKDGYADCIHINVEAFLSWRDRLRVLFGKTLHVDVRCHTENLPGRCESQSTVYAEPFIRHPRQGGGEVAMSARDEVTG